MKPKNGIRIRFQRASANTNPQMDKVVLEDVLTAYKKTLGREPTGPEPNIWRIITKSRTTRVAAALLIIIAALIVISQFGGSVGMASVAWAEVLEAMEDVPTVIFEMTNVTTLWENKTISTVSRVYDAGE
ncbi:MAG: hypothetical protein ACYS4W_03600 [Planctomycetota bacterium]|jgi:hypothetical protein